MKFAGTYVLAAALLLSVSARSQDADAADKPYAGIVARNMFALVPIPPPDTNPPAPPEDPPPLIKPSGIMTIFGSTQVIFKVAAKPKPGQPAKEDSHVLREGEREDDIEVVKINVKDSIITFNNHGKIQELPLVAASSSSGPAPGAGPGAAGPGGAPRPMTPAERAAAMRGRLPAYNSGGMNNGVPNQAGNNSMNPALAGTRQAEQSIEDQALATAQRMAQMEMNRLNTQGAVDQGTMPPLPPTMLTPPDATGRGGVPLVNQPGMPGVPVPHP